MAEQDAIPTGQPPMPAMPDATPPAPEANPTIQVGTGPNQIPVDLSKFKAGDQVTVTLTAKVSSGSGTEEPGAAPTMALEVMSADAMPAETEKPIADMGEKEVGGKIDSALEDEPVAPV